MPVSSRDIRNESPDRVRALIARAMLASPDAPTRVGSIVLWEHQRDAVVRVREALGEFGGALLADEVGLGKTYVALTVAKSYERPIVVAPAALRETWARAIAAADIRASWLSLESLSSRTPENGFDLVIVDEAHHARNPDTLRYRALAGLCASAHVLLLTATPVHNTRRDLSSLLALFLGAHVDALDSSAIARIVVRRTRSAMRVETRMPNVGPTIAIPTADDAGVAERILALPPAVPPRDAGTADALVSLALLRQWSSSVGALRLALRRRIGRTRALMDAVRGGRLPSSADIDAWVIGDDAQQLAFAELLVPPAGDGTRAWPEAADLLDGATRHERALVALAGSLGDDADVARAQAMRHIVAAHPGERVLAFSQFAETIGVYRRLLRNVPGACALTATGGLVAGGRISRAEAIARFAPAANGASAPGAAEAIRVLLTTDLLSEGINLQDASVVVHLDLPWTAARMEQRVGRVARGGAAHESITVYAMAPPASGEAVIDIQRRLTEKLALATSCVGAASVALFGSAVQETLSPPQVAEALREVFRRWLLASTPPAIEPAIVHCAAVRARERGWLALIQTTAGHRIIASLGDRTGCECALVLAVAASCDGAPSADPIQSSRAIADALGALERWLADERAANLAGVSEIPVFRGRRSALRLLAALEALPRVRRVVLDPISRAARSAATGRLSRGAEQSLSGFFAADSETWLRGLSQLPARGHEGASTAAEGLERVVALLVLATE